MEYVPYEQIISKLDIRQGDVIHISSDILRLMVCARKHGERFDPDRFIDSIIRAVGEAGTVLFPTYNWGFCRGIAFDYKNTPCMTGALGKSALRRGDFRRTRHPLYSFAVWGRDREMLCAMNNESSFGPDSPFAYLHRCGRALTIDVVDAYTFRVYIEERMSAKNRYLKTFTAAYIDRYGVESERTYTMFVRYLNRKFKDEQDIARDLHNELTDSGLITRTVINDIPFWMVDFDDYFEAGKKTFIKLGLADNYEANSPLQKHTAVEEQDMSLGERIFSLAEALFPICRSITGDGVRDTLRILQGVAPNLRIFEIPTGTQVFDWTVPQEWIIRDAYIEDPLGNRIISFSDSNLHVMGYSAPIDRVVPREELLEMLHTLPEQPDLIPYVTSYYKRRVGLCVSEQQKEALLEDSYHVVIDSEFVDGFLTYGEIMIRGKSEREIFLSTYICHPSMANNELSGPCVAVYLARWLSEAPRNYSYRIVFVPETIGSIAYLSKHLAEMKRKTIAGFNITCVGDEGAFSFIPSRYGNTLADKVARSVLSSYYPKYKEYSFLRRGSDERQYCAPGVDLPVCSICRSKYGEYPEYHTSADDLNFISPSGLAGSFDIYKKCLEVLEANGRYRTKCTCEPFLSRHGAYPTLSRKDETLRSARELLDFLAYADGTNDILDIGNLIGMNTDKVLDIIERLKGMDLLERKTP